MKKVLLVLVLMLLAGLAFTSGNMEVSISDNDITRLEKIVADLEPVSAIQTALQLYENDRNPILNFVNAQEMKINAIFNEYGIEYSMFTTYTVSNPRAQVVLARLKSRFSYLDGIKYNNADKLRATLVLLEE